MKKPRTLQRKLTLWFSISLIFMALIAFVTVFFVSHSVLQKLLRDELIHTVEDNLDEVEFFQSFQQMDLDGDGDQYIRFEDGYLEIDDDYLDIVNGVYTALYTGDGKLLYGENPISESELAFTDGVCRIANAESGRYYVFDRALQIVPGKTLWLRGVVNEKEGDAPLYRIVRVCLWGMGALTAIAIAGSVFMARRALKPIREMSAAAAQITGGSDLKKRMPVHANGDELARLAESFNGMIARLDDAFEAERQFASDVSHELRTPMAVVGAQCEELLTGEKTIEEYRDGIRLIQRQSRRMNKIISGMLELLRLERKTDQYQKEAVDFSALVSSVCEDMALIGEKGIQLSWNVEPDISVMGDKMLFARLLNNLISNAYRYGRENGHIEVALRKTGAMLELIVQDDGIGIAKEKQEKIFNRLYQVAPDRGGQGAGLGLPMARQIARMYSGDIIVNSEPGRGSTFIVRIPQF